MILDILNWKIYHLNDDEYRALKIGIFNNIGEESIKELLYFNIIENKEIDYDSFIIYLINKTIYNNNLRLTIIPTESCNFRCVYCYENHNSGYMNKQTVDILLKYLRKNYAKFDSINVEWFGGEPLLMKDYVIQISQEIKALQDKYKKPYVASMTTNGYLLDIDTFNKLLDNNVYYYQITLDGPAKCHDALRPHVSGKGTYDVIMKNLIEISKLPDYKYFKIAIRININKSNYNFIDDFSYKLNELFGNDKRFSILYETVKDWGGESVKNIKSDLFNDRNEVNSKLNYNNINVYNEFFESIENRMCHSSKLYGFVYNYDGTVCKCAKALYEDDYIKEINEIGYINKFGKLVFNEMYHSRWLKVNFNRKECHSCIWMPACITMRCPLGDLKNVGNRCFIEDFGVDSIDNCLYNSYLNNKYIHIGDKNG